jgi:hypothetical protein
MRERVRSGKPVNRALQKPEAGHEDIAGQHPENIAQLRQRTRYAAGRFKRAAKVTAFI